MPDQEPKPPVDEVDEVDPATRLQELVATGQGHEIDEFLDGLPGQQAAHAVGLLDADEQQRLLTRLEPVDAADLVEQLPDAQAVEMLELLDPADAARIVQEMPSAEQADLLGELADSDADAILDALDPEEARGLRQLRDYADDVAGGLMVTEYLAYPATATVDEVIADLRRNGERYEDYAIQYAYVVDTGGKLTGVLRLRDLLLAKGDRRLATLMIRDPWRVRDDAPLDELVGLFDRHTLLGVPVVDAEDRLVGVVHGTAVEEAASERSDAAYRSAQGIVGGEELRTMPLLLRSRRRLAWLTVNVLLNILAASVIAMHQDTLSAVIALAVFLPIISDMSGCSGNQAVAVSMRELTLGVVRPNELLRVWGKELAVGVINGTALGLLIAAAAWAWKGSAMLGLVVGAALGVNTVVAVSIGGTVPLVLRRLGLDPALASGPILTTVTDMCGFFLALTFAAAALPHLSGV